MEARRRAERQAEQASGVSKQAGGLVFTSVTPVGLSHSTLGEEHDPVSSLLPDFLSFWGLLMGWFDILKSTKNKLFFTQNYCKHTKRLPAKKKSCSSTTEADMKLRSFSNEQK